MEAMILCGGLGKRLRPVIGKNQKCMAIINGKPVLEYVMRGLIKSGIRKIILCAGFRWKSVFDHFGTDFQGVRVSYSLEEKPLGTGGAVKKALEDGLVDSKQFVLCNGDTLVNVDLLKLLEYHIVMRNNMTVVFTKESQHTGYYMINKKWFLKNDLPNKFSIDNHFMVKKPLPVKSVFIIEGDFFDIGTPENYEKLSLSHELLDKY